MYAIPIGYFIFESRNPAIEGHDLPCISTDSNVDPSLAVFIINLDRSPDRYKKVIHKISRLDFPVVRISAVDGKLLKKHALLNIVDYDFFVFAKRRYPKPGEIGCTMSHRKALAAFLKSPYSHALILEDDADFKPSELNKSLNWLLKHKDIWDLCILDKRLDDYAEAVRLIPELKRSVSVIRGKFPGSTAYLLNKKTALSLIEKIYPIKMPYDDYYRRHWEFNGQFIGLKPNLVGDNGFLSTIQNDSHDEDIFFLEENLEQPLAPSLCSSNQPYALARLSCRP